MFDRKYAMENDFQRKNGRQKNGQTLSTAKPDERGGGGDIASRPG